MSHLNKFLIIAGSLFLASCASTQLTQETTPRVKKKIKARITYYNSTEGKWGSKVSCPNVKHAIEGVTVAASPYYDFGKFGTKIKIPELKGIQGDNIFTVQDRGPAVTKEVASHKSKPVIDVFIFASNRKIARKREKTLMTLNPNDLDIEILDEQNN